MQALLRTPETSNPVTRGSVKIKVDKASIQPHRGSGSRCQGWSAAGTQCWSNSSCIYCHHRAGKALTQRHRNRSPGSERLASSVLWQPHSLQLVFGVLLQSLAFSIGVPWKAAFHIGSLIDTKIVLNGFVGCLGLSCLISCKKILLDKAIMTSTLYGFANFSSFAIQIVGRSPLAPDWRRDLPVLSLKAVLGGFLANLMTATAAGMVFAS